MAKIILVSFADCRYKKSLTFLEENTRLFPFDERHFHTEKDIFGKSYWKSLRTWLNRRGFGYYSWKSKVIKEYFDRLKTDDILVWSDAGIYWNASPNALKHFDNYIKYLQQFDFIVFDQNFIEKEWTKGDIFDVIGVYNNTKFTNTPQCFASIFFAKKNHTSCNIIDKWFELSDISKELITDKRSTIPNKDGFKENRHDQSLFSVLIKTQKNVLHLPEKEIMVWDGSWDKMNDFPIQLRRIKEKGIPRKTLIQKIIEKIRKEVLFIYFNYCRDYHTIGKYMY